MYGGSDILLPILIIHPKSTPRVVKIHHAFRTGELAASALDTPFIIMLYFSIFKSEPFRRTEIKACLFITFTASACIYFDVPLLIDFKAHKTKPLFDTDVHNALIPLNASRIIFTFFPFVPSMSSSKALFLAPSTVVSLWNNLHATSGYSV